jgi:hypothetical protein
LRLGFGLGASPRQRLRRCHWARKVFDQQRMSPLRSA